MELVAERKSLRSEIGRIARDYEGDEENEATAVDDEKFYAGHETGKKSKLVVDEPESSETRKEDREEFVMSDEKALDADEQKGKKSTQVMDRDRHDA